MRPHILYSTYFLLQFNLSNLLCFGAFLLHEESNCILPPSPPKLLGSNFSTATTHLPFLNIYFTMERRKFTAMVTLNNLEKMIEYTLISSTLNGICKMIKNIIAISKKSHLARPPQVVARNLKMGIKMEKTN